MKVWQVWVQALGVAVAALLAACLAVVLIVGGRLIDARSPIQRHALKVEQSHGPLSAANGECHKDMRDYAAAQRSAERDHGNLAAERADMRHMNELVTNCQDAVSGFLSNEVDTDVVVFLRRHPIAVPLPRRSSSSPR